MRIEYLNHEIIAAAFPGMVGMAIQCKKCGTILDCATAAHIEVYVVGKDKPVVSCVLCGNCKQTAIAGVTNITEAKMPDGHVLEYDRAEVIDGAWQTDNSG